MSIFQDFISTYGATILYTLFTAIAGYIGIALKNLYCKYVNDKTKEAVVKTCVNAVEQLYNDLNGAEKLDKCIQSISEVLAEKGIHASELEIRMLIEAAVNELNRSFNEAVDMRTPEVVIDTENDVQVDLQSDEAVG